MKNFLLFFGLLWLQLSSSIGHVVVTSKPLYFIVAPLLKGIDAPKLLLNHGHCGHHHHMRPSEVQLIKSAKLVFWNGRVHEPFMSKIIEAAPANIKVFDETDGFAWLSPNVTLTKLSLVVNGLKKIYPVNLHDQLDSNAEAFKTELRQLHDATKQSFECARGKVVFTTYPFLTYFAKDYGLQVVGYMMGSPEEAMTPQRLKNIYKILAEGKIIGVIKDHHIPINVVQTLVRKYNTPILTVDTEAVDIPTIANGYHILIEKLAQSVVRWAQ